MTGRVEPSPLEVQREVGRWIMMRACRRRRRVARKNCSLFNFTRNMRARFGYRCIGVADIRSE